MASWEKDGTTYLFCEWCGTTSRLSECKLYKAGLGGAKARGLTDIDRVECPRCLAIIDEQGVGTCDGYASAQAVKHIALSLLQLIRSRYGHSISNIAIFKTPDGGWDLHASGAGGVRVSTLPNSETELTRTPLYMPKAVLADYAKKAEKYSQVKGKKKTK